MSRPLEGQAFGGQPSMDAINPSYRPSVGLGESVFDMALRRWYEHSAGDDLWCASPGCAAIWPCPPAVEAERVMDACLTHWTRLDSRTVPDDRT